MPNQSRNEIKPANNPSNQQIQPSVSNVEHVEDLGQNFISEKPFGSKEHLEEVAIYWRLMWQRSEHDRLMKHQELFSQNQMYGELKNEMNAMIRNRTEEVKKLETQELLAEKAVCTKIDDITLDRNKGYNLKITLPLAIMVIAVIFMLLTASNANFAAWVSKNIFWIVGAFLGAIVLVFGVFRKKLR